MVNSEKSLFLFISSFLLIFNWTLFIAGEEFRISGKELLELIIFKSFKLGNLLKKLSEDSSVD